MDLKLAWMLIVFLLVPRLTQAGESPASALSQRQGEAPVFAAAELQAEVSEDAAPGTFVADVAPPGSKRAGAVRYQIVAGDELGAFAVDAASGRVTVAGKLDYEARPKYELQLRATDATGGLPDGQGQARLVVRVADANDVPPAFRSAVYHAELQEEEDPARLPIRILTVEAVDGDSGRPQDVVYSLSGPGVSPDGTGHFSIDARTGDVFLLKVSAPPVGQTLC
ncbi:putative neural-cadherin 2 [Schistocerca gregaria]|uniref:putative neural-cadherin 2 n=1 Tax=Schistocerca gregaria TaxID=7010 RepID=UPI00211DDFF8|nr:putative neural-cadherin 2 [Schistocerca gregaria]